MKHKILNFTLFLLSLPFFSCSDAVTSQNTSMQGVLISAHRGGPSTGFPENALETLQNTAKIIDGVMLEVDVMPTYEGKLILMHDSTLNRTTTLKGNVKDNSLDTIKTAYLVDNNGKNTQMKVPTLEEVLDWIKHENAFLSIDVKDKSTFKQVIDLVNKYHLKEKVEIITYSIEDAELVHSYDADIFISMSLGNRALLERVLETVINPKKVSAFTGNTIKEKSFYTALKNNGIVVTIGTMGNLDKRAKTKGYHLFREWATLGIERFATDYPFEVYKEFKNIKS